MAEAEQAETADSTKGCETLWLQPGAVARLELALAEAETAFRGGYSELLEHTGETESYIRDVLTYGTWDPQAPDDDPLASDFLGEVHFLLANYTAKALFAYAREALRGPNHVHTIRRAIEESIPGRINDAYQRLHPFAGLPGTIDSWSTYFRKVLFASEAWNRWLQALRSRARNESDRASQPAAQSNANGLDAAPIESAREKWLEQALLVRGWSILELSKQPWAPAYNTIQRWASGKTSQQDIQVRAKIAKALSIDISAIPK